MVGAISSGRHTGLEWQRRRARVWVFVARPAADSSQPDLTSHGRAIALICSQLPDQIHVSGAQRGGNEWREGASGRPVPQGCARRGFEVGIAVPDSRRACGFARRHQTQRRSRESNLRLGARATSSVLAFHGSRHVFLRIHWSHAH